MDAGPEASRTGQGPARWGGRPVDVALRAGVVWPPAFLVVVLVEGALRPGYDPVRLPLSLLELTGRGWIQVTNFVVCGALAVISGWAVGRRLGTRAGAILLAIVGAGLIGAGLFPASPGGGYPPGAAPGSATTDLHDVATLLVFGGLALAALVIAARFIVLGRRGWAAVSVGTALGVAVGFALMIVAFSAPSSLTPIGGLIQRVTVAGGWAWLVAVAVVARRGAS